MIDYTVHYKSGRSEKFSCAGKKDLIQKLFEGDEAHFKSEVKLLTYSTGDMFISESVENGEKKSTISNADVNPYGWRNETNSN